LWTTPSDRNARAAGDRLPGAPLPRAECEDDATPPARERREGRLTRPIRYQRKEGPVAIILGPDADTHGQPPSCDPGISPAES
jgi:hypothetical protein